MTPRLQTFLVALILAGSISCALGDDNFALAPSEHDNLIIFGPKGEHVAELAIPTISQVVTVGGTTFQISYGRDANNYLTAILAPSSSQPQDLHFTVLNKTVSADKQAVVTLTFSDSKHVTVDPGYVGNVSVNSHTVRHHELLAEANPAPPPAPSQISTSAPHMAPRTTADLQPRDIPPPSHEAPAPVSHVASTPVVKQTTQTTSSVSHDTVSAPLPATKTDLMSSDQPAPATENTPPVNTPPVVGSLMAQPPMPVPGKGNDKEKFFWAEPITAPGGATPSVGIDQMKLTAVQGPVTLKLPNGETKPATDGMLVPSGSSISTSDKGSAAVFMGGVDSARFLPNTDAKVTENLDGSTRHTSINLKVGTVFSRVGHRPGEKQDYQVTTPEGVAAARGTAYAVCVTNSGGHEVTICATQDGIVTLTDTSDGHKISIIPLPSGQVAIGSIPKLSQDDMRDIFLAFMTDVQQFNANMQAIANNPNPTAADLAYYNSNKRFDKFTQLYDSNTLSLFPLFPNLTEFMDRVNDINYVVPNARRALNQQLEPFGNVPLTPF